MCRWSTGYNKAKKRLGNSNIKALCKRNGVFIKRLTCNFCSQTTIDGMTEGSVSLWLRMTNNSWSDVGVFQLTQRLSLHVLRRNSTHAVIVLGALGNAQVESDVVSIVGTTTNWLNVVVTFNRRGALLYVV
jgi:hypothetical protein